MYVRIEWQQNAEELKALYQAERDGKRRQRLHALWLVRDGRHTVAEVGRLIGVSETTMHQWLNWYRAGGLATLDQHRKGHGSGVVARLSLDDQAILAAYAADGAFRTIDEVRQWVAETFGVTYTYWGMRSVLDRLHIHAKVPRPVNPKADPDAQDAWKKGASRLP